MLKAELKLKNYKIFIGFNQNNSLVTQFLNQFGNSK